MFAVIRTGGKQYRVAAEDVIKVDKVKADPGEIVEFHEVLVVGGDNVMLGAPTIAGASVAAEVLEQGRGPKIIAFKKRRRKNSRRKRGHRQEFTLIRVTEILTDGAKPTKTARAKTAAVEPAKPNGAAVLWIQSGGWYSVWVDSKNWLKTGKPYLDKGFTLFIVRHGSAPRYAIPDAAADVGRSVRFIRLKASPRQWPRPQSRPGHRAGALPPRRRSALGAKSQRTQRTDH